MDEASESARFRRLQEGLTRQFAELFPDPEKPRTVLVLPSLSLDGDVLARIPGVSHYEERLLCLLTLLLRMPRTRAIYVTSEPLAESVVDYFLHLLPGVPHRHARQRLTLLSAHDGAPEPLTRKVLDRPRLTARIAAALGDRSAAHMVCFTVTELERRLALALEVPVYGCDPDLQPLACKSGGRRLFREAGLTIPDGAEDLRDGDDVAEALAAMKRRDPRLRRAVVKLNEGFSGEGNALFRFDGAPEGAALTRWARDRLPGLAFEAEGMDWPAFEAKLGEMQGIAEAFVEGADKRSPSLQCRVDPAGGLAPISTHDQVLGGGGQIFLGCTFPADAEYRVAVQQEGLKAGAALRDRGALGRFGVDFVSVREAAGWRHYAIEINLRKGGTTHPFLMLETLIDGAYDAETATYADADGRRYSYYATDNLCAERYRGLTPDDLIDIAVRRGLHFSGQRRSGVTFHLIGALSQFGKLGAVCIADSPAAAQALFERTVAALDAECA